MLAVGVQYWTSRGFAVVDVDYGGSSGYGRPYRELLRGQWGVVDVADCLAAARALARPRPRRPGRLCIRGGSAGGYTTLAALARDDTPFAAGADHFGVADLEALARDTHKFESRYLDGLVGPYPEAREVYVERSPITHVERFASPLIVLQGAEDAIVPPAQSETIVAALRAKGVPVAYLLFDGEQHGFRRAENVRRALDAELSFYAQVLGFPPSTRTSSPSRWRTSRPRWHSRSMTNERPPIRIGTAERDAAMKALDEHLEAGRLEVDEYGERSARASVATTAPELAELFDDLPAPHPVLPGDRGSGAAGAAAAPAPPVRRAPSALQVWGPRLMAVTPFLALGLFLLTKTWVVFLLIPVIAVLLGSQQRGR